MTKLSLPKKLAKHVVRVGLSFSWDTFVIERIIRDKIVCSGFLSYSIDIDLPFKAPNFNLWVGGFFCHFKKNKKQWRYNHAPKEGNIHVFRGFSIFFFYWNSSNMKLPLSFNKNKVLCRCFHSFHMVLL